VSDVTVKGWVLRETPNKMAWVFLWAERQRSMDTVLLPKSQVVVVKGVYEDEVTLPEWLAEDRGLA
jgi:hypothetical protein